MSWRSIALGAAALVAGAGIALLAARRSATTTVEARTPETKKDKLSYAMGVAMAKSIERQSVEVDADAVARGVKDALSGAKLALSDEDLRQTMTSFKGEVTAKQAAATEQIRKLGETFLAENVKSEGVVTLPSGLQYKVVKAGDGPKPTEQDVVRCHYRGMHVNGSEFDNSWTRGSPTTFAVSRAIPGWKEALKLMPLGSKWTLYLPAKLAFGERGLHTSKRPAQVVAANETVIFDLELLAINPPRDRRTTAAGDRLPPAREN